MRNRLDSQLVAAAPSAVQGIGSLGFLLDEENRDRNFFRYALLVALLLHAAIFVVNWPSFYTTGPEAGELQPPIVVLRVFRYIKPPVQQERIVPPRRRVPIPAPNPEAPEPIRVEENLSWDESVIDSNLLPIVDIPSPPVVDESPVQVGTSGLRAPRLLKRVPPVYPELARKIHYEGLVILELVISKSGSVASVSVLRGEPYGLTEAAVKAARQWLFDASTLNGRPVSIRYQLSVRFKLS